MPTARSKCDHFILFLTFFFFFFIHNFSFRSPSHTTPTHITIYNSKMLALIPLLLLFFSIDPILCSSNSLSAVQFYRRVESLPHRLAKPFLDQFYSSRFYEYGGSTLVKSDSYIRLTGDRAGESGWVFSKLPAMPDSFQIELDFRIHGESTSLYGDGMALWLVSHSGQSGPVFGSSDYFKGFGLFFDTYKNNRPGKTFPYVMGMVGDGATPYDNDNDGLRNELGGCSARNLHNPRDISHARLTYVRNGFLAVELDTKSGGGGSRRWSSCFVVPAKEVEKELSKSSVSGGSGGPLFLGLSAGTGQLSENHDVHRLQVYSLHNPPMSYEQMVEIEKNGGMREGEGNDNDLENDSLKSKKQKGSWLWFFVKLVLFAGALYGAFVGYQQYQKKSKKVKTDYLDY